jgi:hypothetical protein
MVEGWHHFDLGLTTRRTCSNRGQGRAKTRELPGTPFNSVFSVVIELDARTHLCPFTLYRLAHEHMARPS